MLRLGLLLALLGSPTLVQGSPVNANLPEAEVRGAATFRFLGLPLYQARLFTRGGAPLDWSRDFGLELKYLRNLSEYDLVEGTLREFARIGTELPLRGQLERCFADVRKGDSYVAISQGPNKVAFWLNEKPMCTLAHPQIKRRFMAIFLGNNTRSKSFARKLRGE